MKKIVKKIMHSNIFLTCIFVVGLGLVLYPAIASLYNDRQQNVVVMEYIDAVWAMYEWERQSQLNKARAYNEALVGITLEDPFEDGQGTVLHPEDYLEILNVGGVMARLEVPRLNIDLPIFHTTQDDVLNQGVGHWEGSSLPVGGENTHAVLASHSGIPNRRLFTPLLDSHGGIEYGDIFVIRVFGRNLTYEVDQILTVRPGEVESLRVEENADFVTLVTCTPYAINSHRLLVRGVRIDYQEEEIMAIVPIAEPLVDLRALVAIGFTLTFLIALFIYNRRRSKKLSRDKKIKGLIEGMN